MPKSFLGRDVTVRQGAYLPHWTLAGATYAVCFRLADSLPQSVVVAWRREREALLAAARERKGRLTFAVQQRLRELFATRVEAYLDAGQGRCELRRPELAQSVIRALRHFDGRRHRLAAWCVMPNHVHIVVAPIGAHSLPAILKSWKGFSGKEANRILGRTGDFWQPEYYDHLIRDEAEFVHAVRYVVDNPAEAGLVDWPWVWASEESKARVQMWHGSPDP